MARIYKHLFVFQKLVINKKMLINTIVLFCHIKFLLYVCVLLIK